VAKGEVGRGLCPGRFEALVVTTVVVRFCPLSTMTCLVDICVARARGVVGVFDSSWNSREWSGCSDGEFTGWKVMVDIFTRCSAALGMGTTDEEEEMRTAQRPLAQGTTQIDQMQPFRQC
jgi:hypothetical protein